MFSPRTFAAEVPKISWVPWAVLDAGCLALEITAARQREWRLFFTEFEFFCITLRFPGSLLWDSSVKHSLASIAKLLLASRLHQWWFLYNGLEKLLLLALSIHYGITSPQRWAIWICHYFFSQCKYFRTITSSRRMKEMDFMVLILCGGEDNFHTLSLSIT